MHNTLKLLLSKIILTMKSIISIRCKILSKKMDPINKLKSSKMTFNLMKLRRKRIKFVIIAVSAILIIIPCFIIGCQSATNTNVVIEQQEGVLEKIASGVIKEATAFQKIETPEHISKVHDKFEKIRIIFDADVVVPEALQYPITKVTKQVFSENDIFSFIQICSDSNNNEYYLDWLLTKDEWLERLTKAKQYVETGIVTQEWMDTLQKSYDNVSEEVENLQVDILELPVGSLFVVYSKTENGNMTKYAIEPNENIFAYYRNMYLEVYPASYFVDSQYDEKYETIEHFEWNKPGEPKISQDEAYNIALKYKNAMDIDLELYSSELCSIMVDQIEKSTGWLFTFTRSISNLQSQYKDGWCNISPDVFPCFVAPWEQEVLKIAIDKDGLGKLWWQGASQVSTTLIESTELETFSVIQEKIANQINCIDGNTDKGDGTGLDIKITKIELGISMISVNDQTDIGVYIPTWYVSFCSKWSDEDEYLDEDYLSQIYFNAIDGSYIEPRITNSDLIEMIENSMLN